MKIQDRLKDMTNQVPVEWPENGVVELKDGDTPVAFLVSPERYEELTAED